MGWVVDWVAGVPLLKKPNKKKSKNVVNIVAKIKAKFMDR